MNKKILGIGATSAVAALLPVMGVFATTERTDTLNVTVEEGCAFAANATDGEEHSITLAPGTSIQDIMGVKFDITCSSSNETNVWKMSAVGANNSTDLTSGANKITTGTNFSESSSNWAFKLIANGTAKVETGFDAYHAVPGEATKVASSGDDATASKENGSIQAAYAVSAATGLQAGTYTGGVTYTLTNEAKTGA